MEGMGITEDTIKKAGAIAVPIIAASAAGRIGIFSSRASQVVASRAVPRALRASPVVVR